MNFTNESIECRTCLAVDLGGTKLLVGEVGGDGCIIGSKWYPSPVTVSAGQKETVEAVEAAIRDYIRTVGLSRNVCSIGMGMVGRVDSENGLWLQMDQHRAETVPVSELLEDAFHMPCAVDNDVRCAATAEDMLGWGRKSRNFIYINIGTGIAAGFVIDGRLLRGASFNAGEIGHHVVRRDSDVLCPCGRRGCVEAIASGYGLDRRARSLKPQYPESPLVIPESERCEAKEIFRLADAGDPLCSLLAADAVDALSNTIQNLVWVTDPDTVVLGGGLISDGWLLPKLKAGFNRTTMRFVRNGVVLTDLDPRQITFIGAGIVGLQHFKLLKGVAS